MVIKNVNFFYLRIMLAILVLSAGLFFISTNYNFDTDYRYAETLTNIEILQLQNGDVFKQIVQFDHKRVHSIGISAVNRSNDCEGYINVSLLDGSGKEIWGEQADVGEFQLQKVRWYRLKCDVNEKEKYVLSISTHNFKGIIQFAGVASEDSVKGVDDAVMINEERQNGKSLFVEMAYSRKLDKISRVIILAWTVVIICHLCIFEVLYAEKRRGIITIFSMLILAVICTYMRLNLHFESMRSYKIFTGVIFLIALAMGGGITMLLKGCKKIEMYFILYSVVFGVLYSVLLPPFSAPDENRHFAAAYRLSNAIMGQKVNDEKGMIYMRECDAVEHVTSIGNEYFMDTLKLLLNGEKNGSEDMVSSTISFNPKVPITLYAPQALGITIGRILHISYVRLVYLGRFTNLLCFIFITATAIKLVPYGKWVFFSICQIPLVMEIVSSYSYDTIILAMTFLIIAYNIKLIEQREQMSKKQLIIFAVICTMYAPMKPVYLPVIALLFLIPNSKISALSGRGAVYKVVVVLLAVIMVGGVYKGAVFSIAGLSNEILTENMEIMQIGEMIIDEEKPISIKNEAHYQRPDLNFIIENPFDMIESFAGAVLTFSDEYLLSAFGKYLGWYDTILPTYVAILTMVLFYASFVCENQGIISSMTMHKKIWAVLMMTGCWLAILLTFYLKETDPSRKLLIGVQGRYFIPTFACVVFLLRGGQKKHINLKSCLIMSTVLLHVVSLMSVCDAVWNR